ncbi:MAG: hypothetical protein AAGF93_00120 [Cyanobacteria bacterium P01_H01_bin.105]
MLEMLNTDFLLELLLAENSLILMAVLTLLAKYFSGNRGERLEATLETLDSGVTAGAERVEDAYQKLKFQYGELKDLYLATKQASADGFSLEETRDITEGAKNAVSGIVQGWVRDEGESM